MRKTLLLIIISIFAITAIAQPVVTFSNLRYWTPSELAPYVGQTIRLSQPWHINSVQSGSVYGGPRRSFSPTNIALPGSSDYDRICYVNNSGLVRMSGLGFTPRMGEMLTNLVVTVNSTTSVTVVGSPQRHFTYSELNTPPNVGKRDEIVLVCCMNLCYFLVENLGSGSQGPTSSSQQTLQYSKIIDALTAIDADIYGFVEIEQGQGALQKLAQGLTHALGRQFSYINDGLSASGTWTKAGYVYCTDRIERVGSMVNVNTGVKNRKKLQTFRDKASGESFVLGINHFKAKVNGPSSGIDADQGDGQGAYNNARKVEAQAVLSSINTNLSTLSDPDILLMGDLNAYAKEDPIRVFTDAGYRDLHEMFHADTAYSYVYTYGEYTAGYLDHALANSSMAAQVCGAAAWHINSDEPYNKSYRYSAADNSKFRCSDHDPILVGIKLGDYHANNRTSFDSPEASIPIELTVEGGNYILRGATKGYLRIYSVTGVLEVNMPIDSDELIIPTSGLPQGIHIINAYGGHSTLQAKIIVR
ncbi:MAG TPA: hypothetical protein DEO38_04875 [Bacteroidales bacterium]|nr:hypothetical protein [Bacteroidales bacterium]